VLDPRQAGWKALDWRYVFRLRRSRRNNGVGQVVMLTLSGLALVLGAVIGAKKCAEPSDGAPGTPVLCGGLGALLLGAVGGVVGSVVGQITR
jgi:hypothetical protein